MSTTPRRSGRLIYTDYVFLFQVAGLILLVAMIGAIVLTHRDRGTVPAAEHRPAERAHARPTRWRSCTCRSAPGVDATASSGRSRSRELVAADEPHEHGVGTAAARESTDGCRRSASATTSPSAAILLVLGMFGIFLNRKNVIVIMMSIELILLAVNLNLVAFSRRARRSRRARCSRCSC